jgi:hypothetical protein
MEIEGQWFPEWDLSELRYDFDASEVAWASQLTKPSVHLHGTILSVCQVHIH